MRVVRLPGNERRSLHEKRRIAVVFWRSQSLLERSMWDVWPSPTLLKERKFQRISAGWDIVREQS